MIVMGIDPGVDTGIAVVRVGSGEQELTNYGHVRWVWDGMGHVRCEKAKFYHPIVMEDIRAVVMGLPSSLQRIAGRDPRVLPKCTMTGGMTLALLGAWAERIEYYAYDEVSAIRAIATIRKREGPRRAMSPSNGEIWTAFWAYFPEAEDMMIEQRPKNEHVRDAALYALCIRFLAKNDWQGD